MIKVNGIFVILLYEKDVVQKKVNQVKILILQEVYNEQIYMMFLYLKKGNYFYKQVIYYFFCEKCFGEYC